MAGADTSDTWAQLEWVMDVLKAAGLEARGVIRPGEVEPALHAYQQKHDIDLLVMGAYGHSRMRELLPGSTTTRMLQTAISPPAAGIETLPPHRLPGDGLQETGMDRAWRRSACRPHGKKTDDLHAGNGGST